MIFNQCVAHATHAHAACAPSRSPPVAPPPPAKNTTHTCRAGSRGTSRENALDKKRRRSCSSSGPPPAAWGPPMMLLFDAPKALPPQRSSDSDGAPPGAACCCRALECAAKRENPLSSPRRCIFFLCARGRGEKSWPQKKEVWWWSAHTTRGSMCGCMNE